MPSKRFTPDQIRQNLAAAKSKPATGRSIAQNLRQTLTKVKNAPATAGTGTLQS